MHKEGLETYNDLIILLLFLQCAYTALTSILITLADKTE